MADMLHWLFWFVMYVLALRFLTWVLQLIFHVDWYLKRIGWRRNEEV